MIVMAVDLDFKHTFKGSQQEQRLTINENIIGSTSAVSIINGSVPWLPQCSSSRTRQYAMSCSLIVCGVPWLGMFHYCIEYGNQFSHACH